MYGFYTRWNCKKFDETIKEKHNVQGLFISLCNHNYKSTIFCNNTHTHTHIYTWMYVLLSNFTIKPQYKKHINQTHETVFCSTSISITVLTKHLNF
jgi:hypothetical protein